VRTWSQNDKKSYVGKQADRKSKENAPQREQANGQANSQDIEKA